MSDRTINYHLCLFCFASTNTREELDKLGEDIFKHHDSGPDQFVPSNGGMGRPDSSVGTWIKHDTKDKLWCNQCTVPEPTPVLPDSVPPCGAPGCVSCRPGQIHYCDRCYVKGATHRARDCPCPKAR